MLLEIRRLNESLKITGIAVGRQDNHLVAYPKSKPVFQIGIGSDGKVKGLERLSTEKILPLLKYESSKVRI